MYGTTSLRSYELNITHLLVRLSILFLKLYPCFKLHRAAEVGRDLWQSPSPAPCSSSLPRTASRQLLGIPEDGEFIASLGNLK